MHALHDMHCHLDFMANGLQVAREGAEAGTLLFANTVTPAGYEQAASEFSDAANATLGLGLHPWWIESASDADRFCEALDAYDPYAIGEVGLDFGRRHASTASLQIVAFERSMRWAAHAGGRLISIHSVHAAREALDTLQATGVAESCTCIFHWFSGPSDQLKRAAQMGCYFSFGTRALGTGKGREYVKALPAERLLLETDYPPEKGQACSFCELRDQLAQAAEAIAAIKGPEALAQIAETSERLLMKRA